MSISVIRVVNPGGPISGSQLRPATVLPTVDTGLVQAYGHGKGGSILRFLANKGWFFKRDSGTNVVLGIQRTILESLEEKFCKEDLTEEQQRQFGCVLMTSAQLYQENQLIQKLLITYLNTDRPISELVESFPEGLPPELKDTGKNVYQYWDKHTRSLEEGQGKVDEMLRRKFALDGNTSLPDRKFMSSKHDLALQLSIDSGSPYDKDSFNEKIKKLEDAGHIFRKVKSWNQDQRKIYLVSGALHTLYLQKHNGVPEIPADANKLANFKHEAIVELEGLKARLHNDLHDSAQSVIDEIKSSDTKFSNFIQFGSLADKSGEEQAKKRQIKDSCVLRLNEAVVQPKDNKIQTVYKIADIFNNKSTTIDEDDRGQIYTYLLGIRKEESVGKFKAFVSKVQQKLASTDIIKSDDYLKLFEDREEEGLWMLSWFMQYGRVNDDDAKVIINRWIDGTSMDKSKADRRKAIVISEAQNKIQHDRLHRLLGNEAEVVRVLMEVPIRIAAGGVHYVVEDASISCLSKYLDNKNDKLKCLAARTLCHLSADSDNRVIRKEGAIPKLIEWLSINNIELQIEAARTLYYLSADFDNWEVIRKEGAIPKLIECLSIDNIELQIEAARTLCDLNDRVIQSKMFRNKMIPKLIECLSIDNIDDNIELKIAAVHTLGALSSHLHNSKVIRKKVIPKLIECYHRSNNIELKEAADETLFRMTQWDPVTKRYIYKLHKLALEGKYPNPSADRSLFSRIKGTVANRLIKIKKPA